jgi:transcriptional regulator with PAS, ATPase and Fis domain
MKDDRPIVNQAIYIINAEGDRVPVSISTAILRDKRGEVIGGVETFRDLSLVEELRRQLDGQHSFSDIISKNDKMQAIFDIIPEVAKSDSSVLIQGESGTGKEILARAIHDISPRSEGPMVVVNCGALPDNLLESELFGYKAGAFTDARRDKPGRFALAKGGTVFLDEIGDITPALQVRLLRFLQERTYEPLGGTEPVKADVRVIAATNQDLSELVERERFRLDLYYRINVVKIELPPLRHRREDIPLLTDHFIGYFNRLRGEKITGVSHEALRVLMTHDYPGNIRELENIIEHAFVLCRGGLILPRHLPEDLREKVEYATSPPEGTFADLEAHYIMETLRRNDFNRQAAARELGIHKTTLWRKIRKLGLNIPPRKPSK